ncbi:hypothetical protein VTL71DRAFT_5443 [Oculimacula yallundae]|uniref:FAD/NAD(P)-binding domain-containing protein n=1 Tax=Oculimacula yallundae TaxID=86028 RepID=A0ABR4C3L9_9HELO
MTSSNLSSHHDVVIIGAGHTGIIAAKTYLQIDPSVDLRIIDGGKSIGGVWSAERIYPGLIFEFPYPLVNFTDFDMGKELGVEPWSDVTGEQVNEFLNRYAQKYDIHERCQLNTQVLNIEKYGRGWKIATRGTDSPNNSLEDITCNKLIIATGITSKPKPAPWDLSNFKGTSFHAVEMGQRQHELLTDDIKHVTIVGGHKSALEAVGACARVGKKVEWVIRKEGLGPTWTALARDAEGKSLAKLSSMRFMGFTSNSVYCSDRWLNRFLHSGKWWLGTWILNWFWRFMTATVKKDVFTKKNRYHKSENGRKLEPAVDSFFWFVPGSTILHERDLETFKILDEGTLINVTRENLISATGKTISLSNGDKLSTDAIVYCTGWDMTFPAFFSPSLAAELGIAVSPSTLSTKQATYWETLDASAEAHIDALNPMLKNPPISIKIPKPDKTPYRLYRAMVPPSLAASGDNSLVILGNYAGGRVQQAAQIHSLWAVAYLTSLLPKSTKAILQNEEAMNRDIAHVEAFRRKRYLNTYTFRLAIFENPEYEDAVLEDLGLRADRKAMRGERGWRGVWGWKAWWQEWFGSYLAEDYRGIVGEFLESVEKRREGGEEGLEVGGKK